MLGQHEKFRFELRKGVFQMVVGRRNDQMKRALQKEESGIC